MNQNYNQLKVGAEGLLHENEDLKTKLKKKEADAANASDRAMNLEEELRQLGNSMSKLEADYKRAQQELMVSATHTHTLFQVIFLCTPFLSKSENVRLFSSSLPQSHETPRMFTRTEQTLARARSVGVIFKLCFWWKASPFGLERAPLAS